MIDEIEVGRPASPKIRVAFEVADSETTTDELVAAGATLIAAPDRDAVEVAQFPARCTRWSPDHGVPGARTARGADPARRVRHRPPNAIGRREPRSRAAGARAGDQGVHARRRGRRVVRRRASASAAAVPDAPWVEVGSYCGRSTIWLGAAARESGTTLFAVDHHRGSEENQAGWEWHDADVVDARTGKMDTLPFFRAAIHDAALEEPRRRRRRPLAGRRPALGHATGVRVHRRRVTASSRRARTTRVGRHTSRWPERLRSTTCSLIPPTAGGHRTSRSTCRPSRAAGSGSNRSPGPCGCCAVSTDAMSNGSGRANELATKRATVRAFVASGSAHVLLPVVAILGGLRLVIGDWGRGDVAVALAVIVQTGFVEWFIHLFVLHARRRRVDEPSPRHRIRSSPAPPRSSRPEVAVAPTARRRDLRRRPRRVECRVGRPPGVGDRWQRRRVDGDGDRTRRDRARPLRVDPPPGSRRVPAEHRATTRGWHATTAGTTTATSATGSA